MPPGDRLDPHADARRISRIVTSAPAASSSAVSQPVALPPMTPRARRRRPDASRRSACASWTFGPADAGDRRDQRLGAGGHDDDVGRRRGDRVGVDLDADVDLDAELAQQARLEVAEAQHLALARRQRRRPRACRRAARRAPRSRRRGRAGARSAPPPCPPGRCRRPSRGAASAAGSTPSRLAAGLRVDRAAGPLAAADEVDAGVAGDARPQLVELPCSTLRGQSGSAISARPSGTRSASPAATTCAASAGSSSRPTAITGHAHGVLDRGGERGPCARAGRTSAPSVTCSVCQVPAETLIAPRRPPRAGGETAARPRSRSRPRCRRRR